MSDQLDDIVEIALGRFIYELNGLKRQETRMKDSMGLVAILIDLLRSSHLEIVFENVDAEIKQRALEKAEKFLNGFKFPLAEDFPQELVDLVEKRIQVLEQKQLPKKEGNQEVHDPDSTAEYEVLS